MLALLAIDTSYLTLIRLGPNSDAPLEQISKNCVICFGLNEWGHPGSRHKLSKTLYLTVADVS